MERVIDCPICYDPDRCFEDMQEKFRSYMCFNCGFMSNSHYTEENLAKAYDEFFDQAKLHHVLST